MISGNFRHESSRYKNFIIFSLKENLLLTSIKKCWYYKTITYYNLVKLVGIASYWFQFYQENLANKWEIFSTKHHKKFTNFVLGETGVGCNTE